MKFGCDNKFEGKQTKTDQNYAEWLI